MKLKPYYFGHLMRRADSLEKTLMLGKIEGRRRRGRQRMRWSDGTLDSMDMSLSEIVKDREASCCTAWGCKELNTTEQLNNNKTLWSSNPTPGYILEGNEIRILTLYLYFHVHGSLIYNSQDMEGTQEFTDEWIKKMMYIYKGILLSNENEGTLAICYGLDEAGRYA